MATYPLPLDGTYSLPDIESAIQGEEKVFAKFENCDPVFTTNPASNSLTFEKLPMGTRPKPIALTKKGEAAPAGTQKIWEGTMIVEKTATPVVAYRPT
jgi:hypothetical protein